MLSKTCYLCLALVCLTLAAVAGCDATAGAGPVVTTPPTVTTPEAPPERGCACGPKCECGKEAKEALLAQVASLQEQLAAKDKKLVEASTKLLAAPAYVQINGVYYRPFEGRTQRWEAVQCFGPDKPCEYGWVDYQEASVLKKVNGVAVTSDQAPACVGCGQQRQGSQRSNGGGWYWGKNRGR